MKVLIIGGTGLISTSTTLELLKRGDEVTHYNRGHGHAPDGVKSIVGDRTNHAEFERQMREAGRFDCVIDMVGYDPADAECCVRTFSGHTDHFIFCSTIDVFARPTRLPITEDAPLGGRNTYGSNKVIMEQTFTEAHQRGDLNVSILRPAATYGGDRGFPLSYGYGTHTMDRLRKGIPMIVHGDGQSIWVETHRDDVGPAFAVAAKNPVTYGKSYNVLGEEFLTWDEIYMKMAEGMGAPAPTLVHIPSDLLASIDPGCSILLENFQFNNIFDTTAAKRDLNFTYTIPVVEGIRRYTEWHDTHGGFESWEKDPVHSQIIEAWHKLGADMVKQFQKSA